MEASPVQDRLASEPAKLGRLPRDRAAALGSRQQESGAQASKRAPINNILQEGLAKELGSKLAAKPISGAVEAGGSWRAKQRSLDELVNGNEKSWLDQRTVIVDIRNGRQSRNEGSTESEKEAATSPLPGRALAGATDRAEGATGRRASREPPTSDARAKGHRVPTFGVAPLKLSRLPYFSYFGRARNVDLVRPTDRPGHRIGDSRGSSSSGSSSQLSSAASNADGKTARGALDSSRTGARRAAANRNGYSNISNLFPEEPLSARDYRQEPISAPPRRESSSLLDLSHEGAGLRHSSEQVRFASSAHQQLSGRNSGASRIRSLNSLNSSANSPPGESSRQHSTMRGQNGDKRLSPNQGRPSSSGSGYLTRQAARRSPSGWSLQRDAAEPDCPVHGRSPSPSGGRRASRSRSTRELGPPDVELLHQRRSARPSSLYSPVSPVSPVSPTPSRRSVSGRRWQRQPAYYDAASRFSLYHSPAEGRRSSLAPSGEQLRRILGQRPRTKPLHLHPQWAYSRPFIHLLPASALDLDPELYPVEPGQALEWELAGRSESERAELALRPRFEPFNRLRDAQAIRAVDFHPSGQVYAVGSNSRTLRICAYPAGQELRAGARRPAPAPRVLFKFVQLHRGSIYCVRFNQSGRLLATGSNDQTVHLARYSSASHSPRGGHEYRLTMHDGTVRDLCFVDDVSGGAALLLSAGGGDNKIYVTDCDTGTPFQSMAGHSQTVMALSHWGGAAFASASLDKTVRLWDLRSRACTAILSAPPAHSASRWAGPGAPVCAVRVEPSGRLMATGHSDSTCMLYDLRAARVAQLFRPHEDEIRTLDFSPKSYYLLTGGYDGRVVLSDLQGDLTQPLSSVCVAELEDKVVQLRWHPTDFTFVTTSADKSATLWAAPSE